MKKLVVLFLVVAMSITFFSCEDASGNSAPAPTDFTAINDGTVSQELYDLASVFLGTQMDVTEDLDDHDSAFATFFNNSMNSYQGGTSTYTYNGSDYNCTLTINSMSYDINTGIVTMDMDMVFSMTLSNSAISFTDSKGYTTSGTLSGTSSLTMSMDTTSDQNENMTGTITMSATGDYTISGFSDISDVDFDFTLVMDASDDSFKSAKGTFTIGNNTYNIADFQSFIEADE